MLSNNRIIAALHLPDSVPALISAARAVIARLAGNAAFPSPSPTLALVTGAIDDLEVAQATTHSRLRGAVTVRNEKRTQVITYLYELKAYVQHVADAGDPGEAAALIESAGMAVRKSATRPPRAFAARHGRVSGSIDLVTRAAAHRASYEWESSADGGRTWVLLPVTMQAKTTVTGLAPGSTACFRYRPVTKDGEGDWSDPVSIVVV